MKQKKEWLHFNIQYSGECEAICDGEKWVGRYEIGYTDTGKSRVFDGLFAKLIGPCGTEWLGRSRWSLMTAAKESFHKAALDGVILEWAGADERWYCTGLTDNSGYGYLRGLEDQGPIHMMDRSQDRSSS